MIKKLIHYNILFGLAMSAFVSSCSDNLIVAEHEEENGIMAGEQVLFSACVPQPRQTRAAQDDYNDLIAKFKNVSDFYTFSVKMLAAGGSEPIGTTSLIPITTTNAISAIQYDEYGRLTLAENAEPLYWQSNNTPYAFEATSHLPSGATVAADQSTEELYFAEDYIKGYGYVKAWDADNSKGKYELDAPNYLTAKQWYAANQSALGMIPPGLTTDYYKTIPLYMQHQRARISVILRAGEGIDRDQLQYDTEQTPMITTAKKKVKMEIFSYQGNVATAVTPLLSGTKIQYTERGGAKTDFMTACYDAIVEPHAYADNLLEHKIAAIEVSNLKFSFYAANDAKYDEYITEIDETKKEDLLREIKSSYNLKAGDHLVIDVTLSTGERKILITAYVVDWEDWPIVTKCDDYGRPGEPIAIRNRKELIDFLLSEDNKPGNIAFINPKELNLEAQTPHVDGVADDIYNANWGAITEIEHVPLMATLSLAGATLKLNHTLFPGGIASSGSIVNGTLEFGNDDAEAPIECAIAPYNKGSIERIDVSNIRGSKVKATRGGLVTDNYGSIFRCTTNMPVYADNQSSPTYIGGIAATSLYPRGDNGEADIAVLPVIDMCTVDARVSGGTNVYGGGIVGMAEGKITNNTFEYGITIMQDGVRFKNIIAAKGDDDLYKSNNVLGNQWPTSIANAYSDGEIFSNIRTGSAVYDYVLDSEEELKELILRKNLSSQRARLSDDFTVNKRTWTTTISGSADPVAIGQQHEDLTTSGTGNVLCEIDGNGHIIYLDGTDGAPMLFSNILNHVHDMTIVCLKDVKSAKNSDSTTDAIAPLAYSVSTEKGKLSGIKIKMAADKVVEASNPSGLVVRAYGKAIITDCESNASLKIDLPSTTGSQASYFVGGIVNSAGVATISRCTYHGGANAISPSTHGTVYYGGIVGGAEYKNESTPEIEISDCNSWLSWTETDDDHYPTWGGIIGYAVYGTGTILNNAMKDCQGNWWQAPKATGTIQNGKKEEDIIGRKNSIAPQQDINYGNY